MAMRNVTWAGPPSTRPTLRGEGEPAVPNAKPPLRVRTPSGGSVFHPPSYGVTEISPPRPDAIALHGTAGYTRV